MKLTKLILPLMAMLSVQAQIEEQKINETIEEKSYKFLVMDENFKLAEREMIVAAKVEGVHTFTGPKPVINFREERQCDLSARGVITKSFLGKDSNLHFNFLTQFQSILPEYSSLRKQLQAFQLKVSYKNLPCETSILRVNSYINRSQRRRYSKFKNHFDYFAMENQFNSDDFYVYAYPLFKLNPELQRLSDSRIINRAFNRVLKRNADEYELEENLEEEKEVNWGYTLQKKLTENLEYDKRAEFEEVVSNQVGMSLELNEDVEDFWVANCLNAPFRYAAYRANICKREVESNSNLWTLRAENHGFGLMEDIRLSNCNSLKLFESTIRGNLSIGEKCIALSKIGVFGDEQKVQIKSILARNEISKEKMFDTKKVINSFYVRIKNLVIPDSNIWNEFFENDDDFTNRLNEELNYIHELFYVSTKVEIDYSELVEIDFRRNEILDRLNSDPGWTDPVRPDYLRSFENRYAVSNANLIF